MPAISLVVCLHREETLLKRLLLHSKDCYDDLVVVHDGPEGAVNDGIPRQRSVPIDFQEHALQALWCRDYVMKANSDAKDGIARLVADFGGRFFEGPRCFQQEPHWPFAWAQAKNDWILRLDADEFPSRELQAWLQDFRKRRDNPVEAISGYTCFWPLWNGKRPVTRRWPGGRIFMFHRSRVRFVGMVEEVPIAEQQFEPLDLILCHRPPRKSYGVRNIVTRRQAYHWRRVIAESLMSLPTDLPRWRWKSPDWPPNWEKVRRAPIRHAFTSLYRLPKAQLKSMLSAHEFPSISACLNPGLHHFLLGLRVARERQRRVIPSAE